MNENDDAIRRGLAFEQLVRQLVDEVLNRAGEIKAERWYPDVVTRDEDGRLVFWQCKTWRDVSFSGSAALPAMTAGGITTIIPPLPADYVTETQRTLIISRQVFLIVLMWVTVIAVPLLKQHLHVSPETKETVDDYFNIVVTIAGMITAGLVPVSRRRCAGNRSYQRLTPENPLA
jgi:hypothetical protein